MSDFTDFLAQIKSWTARPDYSDDIVTSFVRMAETTLRDVLRVREMIVDADATIVQRKVALPVDWIEAYMVSDANDKPYHYLPRGDFFAGKDIGKDKYTIRGNYLWFSAPIDEIEGLGVSMSYFQHIPTFTDASTWLHSKYYNIFLQSCNAAAALYSEEFERAATINGFVTGLVEAANATMKRGEISGSKLLVPRRGKRIG